MITIFVNFTSSGLMNKVNILRLTLCFISNPWTLWERIFWMSRQPCNKSLPKMSLKPVWYRLIMQHSQRHKDLMQTRCLYKKNNFRFKNCQIFEQMEHIPCSCYSFITFNISKKQNLFTCSCFLYWKTSLLPMTSICNHILPGLC